MDWIYFVVNTKLRIASTSIYPRFELFNYFKYCKFYINACTFTINATNDYNYRIADLYRKSGPLMIIVLHSRLRWRISRRHSVTRVSLERCMYEESMSNVIHCPPEMNHAVFLRQWIAISHTNWIKKLSYMW